MVLTIILATLAFLGLLLVGLYFFMEMKITNHRPVNYPTAENIKQLNRHQKIVVCLGDSNTHGNVSYNWVDDLSAELPDYQFINAGVNADLSYTVRNRIDEVVACQPDFITLLIGTNDVNFTMGKLQEGNYYRSKKLAKNVRADFAGFQQNLRAIVAELQEKTKAKIALFSLPVMSEDLTHIANQRADEYSRFIQSFAEEKGLVYLPLREKQVRFLQENPRIVTHSFEKTTNLVAISIFLHYFLGKSWDEIAAKHGNQLSPDNLHQNSVSAAMIKQLVNVFLAS